MPTPMECPTFMHMFNTTGKVLVRILCGQCYDGFTCNQASYEMVAKDASVFQRYTWETVIVDEGACLGLLAAHQHGLQHCILCLCRVWVLKSVYSGLAITVQPRDRCARKPIGRNSMWMLQGTG